jgi:hypothetical protein
MTKRKATDVTITVEEQQHRSSSADWLIMASASLEKSNTHMQWNSVILLCETHVRK